MQNNALNQYQSINEINFKNLFLILWKGKWLITFITALVSISSLIFSFTLPDEYQSTAIVSPAMNHGGSRLNNVSNQLGGLASLAGININSNQTNDTKIALEVMNTWGFAEKFITKHELEVPLFATKKWDSTNKKLIIDNFLFDEKQQRWARDSSNGSSFKPTSWELFQEYQDRLSVVYNKKNDLIKISITHYSPILAREWTELLLMDINEHMKMQALEEARRSIEYLEKQIAQTSVAEIRSMFSQLIQEQHKNKMLAQISDEYVFKTISSPRTPEITSGPNRFLIIILGLILGGLVGVLFAIAFYRNKV